MRLLTLHPGKGTEAVKCSLKAYSLPSCPPYEALSYTWGPANNPQRILFDDDQYFFSTQNLYDSLTHLRYPDKPRVLWVDAICINQDDDKEKSQQLKNMHRIYSRAQQVLVWLGKSANSSDKAFQWIAEEPKRAQILFHEMLKVLKLKPDFLDLMRKEGLTGPHGAELRALAAKIRIPAYDLDLIEPMVALQKRPYFRRVWVIQETFHAKKIQVYCGNNNVEWDTFVSACNSFWHSPRARKHYPDGEGGLPGPSKLAAVRKEKEKSTIDLFRNFDEPLRSMLTVSLKLIQFNSMDFGQKISAIFKLAKNTVNKVVPVKEEPPFRHLLPVLLNYWNFDASDPKDKVYALLNLTWMKGIHIDYSEDWSIADVLKNTAHAIIAESGSLNILTVSKCSRPTKNFLPSWAPDWTDFDDKVLAFQINPRYSKYAMESPFKRAFTATKESKLPAPSVNGNILTLSGYLIDQIVEVGPVLAHHALDLETQASKYIVLL